MGSWSGTLPAALPSGYVPTGAEWEAIRDALAGLTDNWTGYTSVWASSGTAVSLGNGSVSAWYQRAGGLCVAQVRLTIGSTTTFGTGTYSLTLPFTAITGATKLGAGYCRDSSAGGSGHFPALALVDSGSASMGFFNVTGQVGQLFPFTWASGDTLTGQVVFEPA